jgi:ABC-2 type transport system permease protein
VSSRNVNIFPLFNIVVGIGIVAWALSGIPGTSASGVLLGVILIGAALVIVYAIWFMLTTTAFWFVRVENITELFNGVFRAGQFPVTVFPGWIRIFFTFVVPVAFITTVPAEALIGRFDQTAAATAAGVALLLLIAARLLWRWAVGSYTSASS